MAFQYRVAAHELDRGTVAFFDVRQLGFLEIAFCIVGVSVNERHDGLAGGDVGACTQVEIGDGTVDGGKHFCPVEVKLGLVAVDNGLQEGCARFFHAGLALFGHFGSDEVFQFPVAVGFTDRLCQRDLGGFFGGFGLSQCKIETRRVDFEEHVADIDLLVVFDVNFHDLTGHVRSDLNDVGLDTPVACPGIVFIMNPEPPSNEESHKDNQYGDQVTSENVQGYF